MIAQIFKHLSANFYVYR